jgi:hypothetical protein
MTRKKQIRYIWDWKRRKNIRVSVVEGSQTKTGKVKIKVPNTKTEFYVEENRLKEKPWEIA